MLGVINWPYPISFDEFSELIRDIIKEKYKQHDLRGTQNTTVNVSP